ncbi:hypothetical protein LJC38_00500 [Parabacteroides sp. OttesenSCG-928-K15]|nr:hypothetical protein [Parabacteroides sp. OttesenSCG-928-K15]
MPFLHVIMGPNGAGKSTFGSDLANGLNVFDSDLKRSALKKEYNKKPKSEWPKEMQIYTIYQIDEMVNNLCNNIFTEESDRAISFQEDYAFETPFSYWGMDHINKFKESGYVVIGHFICLEYIQESYSNVYNRVQRGGHFLFTHEIEWNYSHCYKNIYEYHNLFNEIHFYDSKVGSDPLLIVSFIEGSVIWHKTLRPNWVELISLLN